MVAGGQNAGGTLASAEIYDMPSGRGALWFNARPLATGRGYHTATRLGNGKVLVAGGDDPAGGGYASTELFDPALNQWTSGDHLAAGRYYHTATRLGNGKVLVAEGRDGTDYLTAAELYDRQANSWSAAGNLLPGRMSHTATLLGNGQMLVAGGLNINEPLTTPTSAKLYNPATNSGSAAADLPSGRRDHTATLLGNGQVLVAGGLYGVALSSAVLYDRFTDVWQNALRSQKSAYVAYGHPVGRMARCW